MQNARTRIPRALAALVAAVFLVTALPRAAFADELWSKWWNTVTDRESKVEIPFAILFTIGPMLVCTPIWAGMQLVSAIKGKEEEED